MDFKDEIRQLGDRVSKMLPQIQTEEATKNALIMPFIKILGYDVFDPFEVNPEFIADIGIKKGEKIDYAIMKDGEACILIECKHHLEKLDPHNSQLFRYYHASKAKFGLLTNGLLYRFYTDLIAPNKMDEKPFFEFNIGDIKDTDITELKKFHKSYFDVDNIFTTASDLKYSNEIKGILAREFKTPSDNFVRFFVKEVYDGPATAKVITQFNGIVKRSASQLVSEMISERLKSALAKESEDPEENEVSTADMSEDSNGITTTEDERDGYLVVKAILRKKITSERIASRDAKSYFAILLDDNNRKPICRLRFNGNTKYIGLFEGKNEVKERIQCIDDIYDFSDRLLKTIEDYGLV